MSQAAQWDVQGANDTPRRPVVTFIKAGHVYTVNGERVPTIDVGLGDPRHGSARCLETTSCGAGCR